MVGGRDVVELWLRCGLGDVKRAARTLWKLQVISLI
jgi:hypothetical protein